MSTAVLPLSNWASAVIVVPSPALPDAVPAFVALVPVPSLKLNDSSGAGAAMAVVAAPATNVATQLVTIRFVRIVLAPLPIRLLLARTDRVVSK